MTQKTFFNKAIYLATVKRFWVGSALYFLLLMLFSSFWEIPTYYDVYYHFYYMSQYSLWLAVFMAPVVAVLVYRYIHSKKNAVFIHSMPVTRMENYMSTLLGAFTLMGLPVVLQSVILALSTGQIDMTITWMLYTFICNAAMFSVATFAATLTGASWVTFPLYIGGNVINFVVISFVDSLMRIFALGYHYRSVDYTLAEYFNMPTLLGEICNHDEYTFEFINVHIIGVIIAISILFYVLSAILYKVRNLEKSEDASAYTVFNYIVKYIATSFAAILAFFIFSGFMEYNLAVFIIGEIVLTAATYFAIEMILKKTFKVWSSYKGYLIFAVCFTGLILFMASTSIFGFETYVPKSDEIESAFVEGYGNNANYVKSPENIALVRKIHEEIIDAGRDEVFHDDGYIYDVDYCIKDGGNVSRTYHLTRDDEYKIMDSLYENKEFKKEYEGIFSIGENAVTTMWLDEYFGSDFEFFPGDYYKMLECMKNDILNHSYTELYETYEKHHLDPNIRIYYLKKQDELEPFENTYTHDFEVPKGYVKCSVTYTLTPGFEETVDFLESMGYDKIKQAIK